MCVGRRESNSREARQGMCLPLSCMGPRRKDVRRFWTFPSLARLPFPEAALRLVHSLFALPRPRLECGTPWEMIAYLQASGKATSCV